MFIIIGVSILSSFFGNNENNNSKALNSEIQTEKQQQITAKQPEVKTYSVGDEIQAGDFKWKITKYFTAKEIGQDVAGSFFGEKSDGIFIILDVEVENNGKSAKFLMNSFVKLIDEQGREFSPNSAAAFYIEPKGSSLVFEQINPGIKKKGKIIYDVPEDLKVANIRISSSLLESSFYNIKLII